MGAISGDINSNPMQCVDDTDLASRPIGSKSNGDLSYIVSFEGTTQGPYFFLRRGSAEAAGPGVVDVSGAQWLSLALFGGSSSPGSFIVHSYTELDNLWAESLAEGTRVYFTTQHANWYLRLGLPAAGTSADEVRTAQTGTTDKFWERALVGAPDWIPERQADDGIVYIDSVTGIDDKAGASTTPIRTLDEYVRRTEGVVILGEIEIDFLQDSAVILTKTFAPLGVGNTSRVHIVGIEILADSGNLSAAVAFNRGTNVASEYACMTTGGHQLTFYLPGAGGAFRLEADTGMGWIAKASATPNQTLLQAYSGGVRSSIPNAAAVQVTKLSNRCSSGNVVFDARSCRIDIDRIAFDNGSAIFIGGEDFAGSLTLDTCAVGATSLGTTTLSGYVGASECLFVGFVHMQNCHPNIAQCVAVAGLAASACFDQEYGSFLPISLNSPTLYDAFRMHQGHMNVSDIMVAVHGIAYEVIAASLNLTSFAWGPNAGDSTATFMLRGTGSFVSCADFTKIYTTGAGGGQRLAQLVSSSGTATNIADQAALVASGTGIRNSNAFIGFVN